MHTRSRSDKNLNFLLMAPRLCYNFQSNLDLTVGQHKFWNDTLLPATQSSYREIYTTLFRCLPWAFSPLVFTAFHHFLAASKGDSGEFLCLAVRLILIGGWIQRIGGLYGRRSLSPLHNPPFVSLSISHNPSPSPITPAARASVLWPSYSSWILKFRKKPIWLKYEPLAWKNNTIKMHSTLALPPARYVCKD